MRLPVIVVVALAGAVSNAHAQSEAALRAALEGRTVTVKVDMPGTAKGIDVYPLEATPVNWREVADRVKSNATALKIGETVMITKVVVNKGSHIEVQLGGGGFGTFGDNTGTSVSATDAGETPHEKAVRDSIKSAPSPQAKKKLEATLNSLRTEREQKNDRAQAAAASANAAREANLRVKRAEGGSRFNVRYKGGIPANAMTPAGLMDALAPYIDFDGAPAGRAPTNAAPAGTRTGGTMSLKKGMSVTEVEAILGPANTASESREGILTLVKRTYVSDGNRITALFVNGVMIDYTIAPQ